MINSLLGSASYDAGNYQALRYHTGTQPAASSWYDTFVLDNSPYHTLLHLINKFFSYFGLGYVIPSLGINRCVVVVKSTIVVLINEIIAQQLKN